MESFNSEHSRKVRIAWLYYVEGLTQDKIAQQLGITRMRVQRLLAQARDEGIVRVTITDPIAETIAVAAELKTLFGLREAIVAPAPSDDAQVRRFTGHAAAEFLATCLHDGLSLGVGWGTTLVETARALPPRPLERCAIVALLGGLTRSSSLNPHEIAWRLARTLRAECFYLAAPTYTDSVAARQAIVSQPSIHNVLQRGRAVDVALVSVGTFSASSTMRRAGLLSDEDAHALEQVAAVGDILGYQLDRDGRVVDADVNERVIAIPPDALRTIETVILVSGGLEKTAVIRAALRGGYANVLVTDEAAAAAIVAAERAERTPAGAVADRAAPEPTMELASRAGGM